MTRLSLPRSGLSGTLQNLSFSSFTNLITIDLVENDLHGEIPFSLYNLSKLVHLHLAFNHFSGVVSPALANLSRLSFRSLIFSELSSFIPHEIGKLKSLTVLALHTNKFTCLIPTSIGNLTNLIQLFLHDNHLSGPIPTEIVNLRKLTNLELSFNKLSENIPREIGQLTNVAYLVLSDNNLSGAIPAFLGNLTNLIRLYLSHNYLSGNIPPEIGNLGKLLDLVELSYNNFTGQLPQQICGNGLLENFAIIGNHFRVRLEGNQLTGNLIEAFGKIPEEFQNLKLLLKLILSGNQLYGEIPSSIGMLVDLKQLHLAANNLSGPVPKEVRECLKLWQLNLENNKLEGSVPFEIATMNSLQIVDLSSNFLTGEIPSQLGQMKRLETLNLSHNYLSGYIPSSFNEMSSLMLVDMSYNQLEGPIPDSKAFREAPCNSPPFPYVHIFGFLNILRRRVKNTENLHDPETQNKNLFAIWSYDGKLVYENIIPATEEFNSKYCIGEGGYGSVYKVELSSGQVVAVKKLHTSVDGGMSHVKAFTSEIRTLIEIRHRNIVKLYGFCSHPQHSLLVYEYLEGGSLGDVLRNEEKARAFEWSKRLGLLKLSHPIGLDLQELLNIPLQLWSGNRGNTFGEHPGDLLSSISSTLSSTSYALGHDEVPLKDILDQRISAPTAVDDAAGEVVCLAMVGLAFISTQSQRLF
ncbi:probable leucine-rich repeat receptor-like protein kinase At1g35710 [Ziziphus jujuba]|uniref:Probable leucine-rich repeat receptor-like protein kinase At1g35710 n=1 Tax=Ziziphus jujuba TaxID=326968 RepID=A0ABM4A942_ZIZJJ|nr:probable leucine-rich repeat receptor-like protein kinase At1g35710 [Ziziphus jujuba]